MQPPPARLVVVILVRDDGLWSNPRFPAPFFLLASFLRDVANIAFRDDGYRTVAETGEADVAFVYACLAFSLAGLDPPGRIAGAVSKSELLYHFKRVYRSGHHCSLDLQQSLSCSVPSIAPRLVISRRTSEDNDQ